MNNKKSIIAVIALVLVVAVFAGIYFATRPATSEGSKTFTLTVVHGDGSSKNFTISTDEEYLAPALKAEGILPADEGADGMYLTVDGEKADFSVDQSFWYLYIGEEDAMLGMNDTPVNDGDSFKLVYTTYDNNFNG